MRCVLREIWLAWSVSDALMSYLELRGQTHLRARDDPHGSFLAGHRSHLGLKSGNGSVALVDLVVERGVHHGFKDLGSGHGNDIATEITVE